MKLFITGGTGSLGQALLCYYLPEEPVSRIVVYSRDEVKQGDMYKNLADPHGKLRFFLGDVRDRLRLEEALHRVDTVIHAAALKRVDQVSYNPSEVLATNVTGTLNVLRAGLRARVKRILLISSDKAVHPANVYGATKLMAEFLTTRSNVLSAPNGTISSVLRYGNVWGSRGSVKEVFEDRLAKGLPLQVTNPEMTRFFVTLPQAVMYVRRALDMMHGGEIFTPMLSKWTLRQVVRLYEPDPLKWEIRGMRAGGEKLHERLIGDEELGRVVLAPPFHVILPELHEWTNRYPWDRLPKRLPEYWSSDDAPTVPAEALI